LERGYIRCPRNKVLLAAIYPPLRGVIRSAGVRCPRNKVLLAAQIKFEIFLLRKKFFCLKKF
jgi:hypothetical protein